MKTYIKIAIIVAIFFVILSLGFVENIPETAPEIDLEASDGYIFEGKEFQHTEIDLKVIVINNVAEFDALKNKLVPGIDNLQAFSAINPFTNSCTVYVKDPLWEYQPEFLGHEIAHCIWGRWHNHRDQIETEEKKKNEDRTSQ